MATLGATYTTLTDLAKRTDPDGKVAKIAEFLKQTNPILEDLPVIEGNLATGHRATIRTGLPTPTWRLLGQGVAPTKSSTAQIDFTCALLEDRSEVDVDLIKLYANPAEGRMSESIAHMQGMNNEMASTLFYGNQTSAPSEFTGLAPHYSSLSAGNAQNVISALGSDGADNTSIWLVYWSEQTLFGFVPKNSQAGLTHKDLGEGDAFDGDNKRYRAYMDLFQWKCGLCVKDWRAAVRICNIDVSNLVAESSAADLTKALIKAVHAVPNEVASMGRPVIYMNRTVMQMLDIQRYNNVKAVTIDFATIDGKLIPHFRGIPIRVCDALLNTEAPVA